MGLRVFIADDEPLTRMDLREMLEEEGYEVVGEAGDGFDAVECCKKLDPDIVYIFREIDKICYIITIFTILNSIISPLICKVNFKSIVFLGMRPRVRS